jgi:uncharacterized membrane protein YphA (DoxX/SURF4 family)
MKKYPPLIAGVILGLLFIMASVMFFLKLGPQPKFPEGSSVAMFMGAFGPTGYLHFVKVFELVGGIAVMVPRLRNFGLLLLGPVIVNIVAFHSFVGEPRELLNPMLISVVVLALYLLWVGRRNFAALLK